MKQIRTGRETYAGIHVELGSWVKWASLKRQEHAQPLAEETNP